MKLVCVRERAIQCFHVPVLSREATTEALWAACLCMTSRGERQCALVVILFDVSCAGSRETYNHLVSWLTDARTLARPDITGLPRTTVPWRCVETTVLCSVVVVGNKCDKKSAREVTLLEASRFAQENGVCVCVCVSGSALCVAVRMHRS